MRGSGSYDWCILYCGESGEIREKEGREGREGWGVKERERERCLIKFYVAITCARNV